VISLLVIVFAFNLEKLAQFFKDNSQSVEGKAKHAGNKVQMAIADWNIRREMRRAARRDKV
jgi:hypothetical protein